MIALDIHIIASPGYILDRPPAIACAVDSGLFGLSTATNRLTALLDNQNEEGYTFKLTGHAFLNAWDLLKKVHLFLGDRFITPSIVSDGEGGVDIEWARNDKEVLMGVRGESHKDDYVYFQQGAIYGGENLSLAYLKDRLEWLFQDEL